MAEDTVREVTTEIMNLRSFWLERNRRFQEWYEFLTLVDTLKTQGLESYVSNEPQTFYNMAHYLLTKGELSHTTPIETESALELERRAKVHRGCQYMWGEIDRERQLGGQQPYVDELGFYLLTLGWYSVVLLFNEQEGKLFSQLWNPYDVYPSYVGNKLHSCVHSYELSGMEAKLKAEANNWSYEPRAIPNRVTLDDYYLYTPDGLWNMILIDSKDVTGWVHRPNMRLLVSPVGGFPDKGSLTRIGRLTHDWKKLTGRGIFEVNSGVSIAFNKWKSQIAQVLRDNSNPITQEFSASPQATPEQLRQRGSLFHYAPGESGLQRVPPPSIPIELQANILDLMKERQKGSFNDAVYGMVEGQPGYALSLLASSSANQILYPYMDAKHFVISEADRFWLSNLRSSKKVFAIKGKFIEQLKPVDIPNEVSIQVESNVATPKDWLERGTIANMLKEHLDEDTIITEIFGKNDPQAIKRRKRLDKMLDHPMTQLVELITSYENHAEYLEHRGDGKQAARFRKAAAALEAQLGVPPAGSASPEEATEVSRRVEEGAPRERTRVSPRVSPPEAAGFTPTELRRSIGRGSLRGV